MEKIVVIGTGFICEYMRGGMKAITESDDLSYFVYGIKGTDRNVAERRHALGFGVGVNNSFEMMRKINPTVVILCCSPESAEYVIDRHLEKYYAYARLNGITKPDLYSFIPSPSADVILGRIGGDANVVKILPNILDRVCGYDMSPVGINYVTYRNEWPDDRKEILKKFLAPYGFTVNVNDRDSLVLLTGKITSHVCYEVSYDIADVCAENGCDTTVNGVGSAMIRAQHEIIPEMPVICESGYDGIPEKLIPFVKQLMRAWYDGIRAFTTENAETVTYDEARHTDMCSFALNVFPIRHKTREELAQDTKNAATKGGILERGIEYYMSDVSSFIRKGVSDELNDIVPAGDYFETVKTKAYEISREAFIRSLNLTGRK